MGQRTVHQPHCPPCSLCVPVPIYKAPLDPGATPNSSTNSCTYKTPLASTHSTSLVLFCALHPKEIKYNVHKCPLGPGNQNPNCLLFKTKPSSPRMNGHCANPDCATEHSHFQSLGTQEVYSKRTVGYYLLCTMSVHPVVVTKMFPSLQASSIVVTS